MLTDLEPNSRLRLIRRAIEKKWISAHCMTRMVKLYADCADEYGFDQVPIPWADAVCGKLKPKQRKMIEAACAADDYDWVDFSSTYFSEDLPGRDCQLKMSLPADLRFDSVFRWLCFVVEGHLDPQLRDVHESFHVKSLPDYRRYQNAWRRLTQRPGAADDFSFESLTE